MLIGLFESNLIDTLPALEAICIVGRSHLTLLSFHCNLKFDCSGIAPDYLMVHEKVYDKLVAAMKKAIKRFVVI